VKRPVGVTIVAVIAIVYGIFNLLLAFLGLIGIALQASGVAARLNAATKYDVGTLAYAAISDAVLGILYLVFGIGAFRLKGWAWITGVIALVLDVVKDIVGDVTSGNLRATSIITGVIALLLLLYLFRPNVRTAFGKTA
jgi:uncharacterized membrane protein (DUF2068 family)